LFLTSLHSINVKMRGLVCEKRRLRKRPQIRMKRSEPIVLLTIAGTKKMAIISLKTANRKKGIIWPNCLGQKCKCKKWRTHCLHHSALTNLHATKSPIPSLYLALQRTRCDIAVNFLHSQLDRRELERHPG